MAGVALPARREILGGDVRRQLPLEQCDLILDHQLAFFQPLQLQLIDDRRLREPEDHVVKIAMLELELGDARFDGVGLVGVRHEWCRQRLGEMEYRPAGR